MSFPFMPIYWGDYFRGTQQFTNATEHGAYMLLIAYCWNNGSLPENDDTRRRIAKCTMRQWSSIRDLVMSKFSNEGRNERCDEERAKAIEKSKVNSANAQRRHSERIATVMRSDTQPQPQPQPRKKRLPVAEPPEFVDFWNSVPRKEGRYEAIVAYRKAIDGGADPLKINAAAKRWCLSEEKTEEKYIALPATWLNKRRFEDYHPPPERETNMEYDEIKKEWRWKRGREPENPERAN